MILMIKITAIVVVICAAFILGMLVRDINYYRVDSFDLDSVDFDITPFSEESNENKN